MDKGIVRQIGTPAEVYDDPADTFVATFLGSPPMNLVESADAIVGFRPEHLLPAGFAAAAGALLPFAFRLGHEEYLGSERILYGRLDGGRLDGKRVVSRVPASYRTPMPEDSVHRFEVAQENLRFFDGRSGARRGPVPLS
jgi:multiple sugar transport system ATP-binding protein